MPVAIAGGITCFRSLIARPIASHASRWYGRIMELSGTVKNLDTVFPKWVFSRSRKAFGVWKVET